MFKISRFISVIALFALSTIYAESVSGVITNNISGEPVAFATVTAFPVDSVLFNDSTYITTTNDTGYYYLGLEAQAEYLIVVEHPDYETLYFGPVIIAGNAVINLGIAPLNQPNINFISGRVRDEYNFFSIQGALVKLEDPDGAVYLSVTGSSGDFYISDINPGMYDFSVTASGYYSFNDSISIEENTQISNLTIYLTPDNGVGVSSLSGLVYYWGEDSTFNPVPNANVNITALNLGLTFETTSDDTGAYGFVNIPSGEYILDVIAPGYSYNPFNPIIQLNPGANNLNIMMNQVILPPSGTVKGNVVFDGTGQPVMFAGVHFIPINTFPIGLGFYTYGMTDSTGEYTIEVPHGSYYVMVEYFYDPIFIFPYQEYYDDVFNISEASVIEVVEDQVIENINFGIPDPQPVTIEVEGIATDSQGQPLAGAQIKIMLMSLPGLIGEEYTATTDLSGSYNFLITDLNTVNASFIIEAGKEGYTPEYWDNKPDMFSADLIRVSSDTLVSGINFSLEEVGSLPEYSISGIVADSGGNPINGAFIAVFGLETGQFGFGLSDESGNYSVGNLPQGVYYVLFYAADYVPQFYNNAILWEDATPIDLYSDVSGIDAFLTDMTVSSSPGQISGTILGENGQPLSGVMVGVMTGGGEMIDYGISDALGYYELKGLSNGNHSVMATKIKYQSQVHNVNMNLGSTAAMTLNLYLQPGVTDIDDRDTEIFPDKFELGNNYPNPFNPTTKISFTVPRVSNVKLTVYNLIGQEIATLVDETKNPGRYEVAFEASQLNSGVYFYKLEASGVSGGDAGYVEMKKMILIK